MYNKLQNNSQYKLECSKCIAMFDKKTMHNVTYEVIQNCHKNNH